MFHFNNCNAGGPVLIDALGGVSLHPSEVFSGRNAIQTSFDEYNVGANLPQVQALPVSAPCI